MGAGTTGHTTAKLSLLQGTVLSGLRRQYPQKVVTAYVDANREGQAWLLRLLEDRSVPFQRRDAYTFSVSDSGADRVAAEHTAARESGPRRRVWPKTRSRRSPRNARSGSGSRPSSTRWTCWTRLARSIFRGDGWARRWEGVRVRNVSRGRSPVVETDAGAVDASLVVSATGTPILDRGRYFAKLKASQSYAAALRQPESAAIPAGTYLSAESPGRSLRSYPAA